MAPKYAECVGHEHSFAIICKRDGMTSEYNECNLKFTVCRGEARSSGEGSVH